MKTALVIAGLGAAWFGICWLIVRDRTTHVANLQAALDAHRAYEADLNAILGSCRENPPAAVAWPPGVAGREFTRRPARRMNVIFSCPQCEGDLEDEPFSFWCPACRMSVSFPQAVLEGHDD